MTVFWKMTRCDPPRLLVVEDHEAVRSHLELSLWPEYCLIFIDDGEHAIKWLRFRQPDVALIDRTLTGSVSGLDVVRFMRSTSCLVDVPVAMLTGDTDKESIAQAFRAGVNEYFIKPADPMRLKRWLYDHTYGRQAH